MSAVSTLGARVTALERQVAALRGRAGGGEQLAANYLTANPDGTVAANFSGGVTINASTLQYPGPVNNSITWQTVAGVPVAQIAGQTGNGRFTNESLLNLVAQTSPGGGGAIIGATCRDSTGTIQTSGTIIASDGSSSFLQLPTTQNLHLAVGTGTFIGNGTASVNPTVAIGTLLPSIVAVAACPNPSPTWGGYLSCVNPAPASLQFAANTNGTFANGTTYSFYYIAIG